MYDKSDGKELNKKTCRLMRIGFWIRSVPLLSVLLAILYFNFFVLNTKNYPIEDAIINNIYYILLLAFSFVFFLPGKKIKGWLNTVQAYFVMSLGIVIYYRIFLFISCLAYGNKYEWLDYTQWVLGQVFSAIFVLYFLFMIYYLKTKQKGSERK